MRVTDAFILAAALPTLASPPPARTDRHHLEPVPVTVPGRDLPVIREHTYRMAGKVRMLLLWVGRDDVGTAVIKWRGAGSARAVELVIGADPQRAPGKLNKWGYLVEDTRHGNTSTVAFISQESDDRLSDVQAGLAKTADLRAFDTVRGFVTGAFGNARVGTLHAASDLTYRDADRVLGEVLSDSSLGFKRVPRTAGVRAGFIRTLVELMDAGIAGARAVDARPYIHGDKVYALRLLDATRQARFERDGHTFRDVIRGRFETGQAGARSATRFDLVYGASGALAGIPIVISYQPKWWLHVDLVLTT
jgi:hypothetical protein